MARPRRPALHDLTYRAGKIAIGAGRGLGYAVVNPLAMLRRRHFTMPVQHRHAQQIYLEEYQQATSENARNLAKQYSSHDPS
jgi:hypothetical protein